MYDFLTMLSGKKYCGAEFMSMLSIISIVSPNNSPMPKKKTILLILNIIISLRYSKMKQNPITEVCGRKKSVKGR